MEYEVTGERKGIDFGATGVAEILQNVAFILATPAYSCPLNRGFAWVPDVDAPPPVMQARTTARLIEAIRMYEPRAEVVSVAFQGDGLNGLLKPVVRVRVVDGFETAI
jgi:uncharacterized protein